MTVYDTAAKLPPIGVVRDRSRALAMLDAIIDGVYYDYSRRPGKSETASMRNGSGEEYDIVFTADGAFIRGVYHDSPMHDYTGGQLWPGLLEGLPPQFAPLVHEPTFCHEDGTLDATFVLWRRSGDDRWHAGEGIDLSPADDEETDPDGPGCWTSCVTAPPRSTWSTPGRSTTSSWTKAWLSRSSRCSP
ncbi:hypothetical protein ABZ754_17415 [Micromonospora purpureochromogenes]|uniref:hypothetical protein n=1 Tax=Micromonospora purpureochromogenes TaxID=47872 RepID=UPI0033C908A5